MRTGKYCFTKKHWGVSKMPVNKSGNWSLRNLILVYFCLFKVKLSTLLHCLTEHRASLLCLDMCMLWHRYLLRQKCRPKYLVFSDISLTAILAGITPSESVKVRHSPLASENLTVTWKRCKIGGKLVIITNRKSYMSFRLILKSVTLNHVERRNLLIKSRLL